MGRPSKYPDGPVKRFTVSLSPGSARYIEMRIKDARDKGVEHPTNCVLKTMLFYSPLYHDKDKLDIVMNAYCEG